MTIETIAAPSTALEFLFGAEGVGGRQRRARDGRVEIDADVLGVIRNERLQFIEQFHRTFLSSG